MKTLKLIFGMFMLVMLSIGQADAVNKHSRGQPINASDNSLRYNAQVKPFVPSDIQGMGGASVRCDEQGNTISDHRYIKGSCFNYYSKMTDTKWKIRFTHPNGAANQVFYIRDGAPVLMAEFSHDQGLAVIYEHPDARKLAGTKDGYNNTETAKNDAGDRNNNTNGAANIDTKEIIKKGLGVILRMH